MFIASLLQASLLLVTMKVRIQAMAVKITLKDIRSKRELSQEKLAVLSGVSVSYIQKIEQNTIKRLSLDIVDKLCKVLSCQVSDLLKYSEDDTP